MKIKKILTPEQKEAKKAKRLARLAKKQCAPKQEATASGGILVYDKVKRSAPRTYSMMKCRTTDCLNKVKVGDDVDAVLCYRCTMQLCGSCFSEQTPAAEPVN